MICEELVERKFEVKNEQEKTNVEVNHLQFPLWPNYGVVKNVGQLASFVKQVNSIYY